MLRLIEGKNVKTTSKPIGSTCRTFATNQLSCGASSAVPSSGALPPATRFLTVGARPLRAASTSLFCAPPHLVGDDVTLSLPPLPRGESASAGEQASMKPYAKSRSVTKRMSMYGIRETMSIRATYPPSRQPTGNTSVLHSTSTHEKDESTAPKSSGIGSMSKVEGRDAITW
eukprot:7391770-Prymnesium_polylepis.3